MSDNTVPSTPQDDADRIRLKRLAKLQNAAASSSSAAAPANTTTPTGPSSPSIRPLSQPGSGVSKPKLPRPSPPSASTAAVNAANITNTPRSAAGLTKKQAPVPKFDLTQWVHNVLCEVLKITLDAKVAETSGYEIVWLKHLALDFESEGISTDKLSLDILDRLLIARLELDPQKMTDELDYLPVLVSLPPSQTIFEYLVGCWKRINLARIAVNKKRYTPLDTKAALEGLEKIKHLVVSYAGYTLQEPDMFPQPSGRDVGPRELVNPLLSLSALSSPLLSTSSRSKECILTDSDIEPFLQDLTRRFDPTDELEGILGPAILNFLSHESLFRPEGLGGADTTWRAILSGLEMLVSIKPIAIMLTRLEDWNPDVSAEQFERASLLGPLCRLGVFPYEWPSVAQTYFSNPDNRRRDDIESSFASLRGTLKTLQSSLFSVFDSLVRASPESREAVLDYFAHIIVLNEKRAGMQVDQAIVASDSFMFNIQTILYKLAEPFMDANYTKMYKIDPLFYVRSSRIVLKDETRIKATGEEVEIWQESVKDANAPVPNFISNIFFLTIAMSHYGYLRTIQTYSELAKNLDELKRHHDFLNGDGSWRDGPLQARTEAAINYVKNEMGKVRSSQLAYETGLLDPELVFRSIGFTNFLSTWLIRRVDPRGKHPSPLVELPLPKEVPMDFRVLPEYIVEDIVDYLFFAVQSSPEKVELSGKLELMIFVLTFLLSTWYIKNPFLKSKINEVLFMSIWGYGRERNGVLGNMLNSHPVALKNVMPAMMHFYIEVEQTGASSQFYDKFNARRNISYILKAVWDNPAHREALKIEAKNVDKFVRFINLMINDVTYLMDESLSELTQIHNIQVEMDDKETWESKSVDYRREREGTLRSLERHASSYTTLGRSTVELLKLFTADTKEPFMMPEIVDRLAAMLDYNLLALVGPKCQELRVQNPEKYKFSPRDLLGDIVQVLINLSDDPVFIRAVAGDERSYSKGMYEKAMKIVVKNNIKAESEVLKLWKFVEKVEEEKLNIEEDDLGEVPEEFLDPLMFTLMKDPVRLPSSRNVIDRATIKSHLLSDARDPFNRAPLVIEDVVPELELKSRIESFVAEHRRRRVQKRVEEINITADDNPIFSDEPVAEQSPMNED